MESRSAETNFAEARASALAPTTSHKIEEYRKPRAAESGALENTACVYHDLRGMRKPLGYLVVSARLRFGVAAGAVALSVAGLIAWALTSAPVYYRTPSELAENPAKPEDRLRVVGKVVDGSIARDGATVKFAVSDGVHAMDVTTADVLPDTFGAGVEVVAEGAVTSPGKFTASTVLAKCPSKFKARRTASG